jgi:hypothetical protein
MHPKLTKKWIRALSFIILLRVQDCLVNLIPFHPLILLQQFR